MNEPILQPVLKRAQMPVIYKGGAVENLIFFHNLGHETDKYERPALLTGSCMDYLKRLKLPTNFAFVMRNGGADFRTQTYKMAYAIAMTGVKTWRLLAYRLRHGGIGRTATRTLKRTCTTCRVG